MHTPPFTIRFDDNNQELILVGSLRPQTENELDELRGAFEQALRASSGILYLNAKRLAQLNNVGFREIAALVRAACQSRPDLKISVVTSSFVGWSARKFSKLRAISDNIAVSQYDEEFYPGQGVLEDESFIPILRIQNRMTCFEESEEARWLSDEEQQVWRAFLGANKLVFIFSNFGFAG